VKRLASVPTASKKNPLKKKRKTNKGRGDGGLGRRARGLAAKKFTKERRGRRNCYTGGPRLGAELGKVMPQERQRPAGINGGKV